MARSPKATWLLWLALLVSVAVFWGIPALEGPHELVVESAGATSR